MPNTTFDLNKLLATAPVNFEKLNDEEGVSQQEVNELESSAVHLLFLATYLEDRANGANHITAAKNANRARAEIRKALGYNVTHPINF